MAKRFNVSIPDALAERLEPHKDKISLSAVMQAALERELAQLNLSDTDKQRRASLKATAVSAWLKRNTELTKALGAFADHLLDCAINDGLPDLFMYYRQLVIGCRKEELITKILESPSIHFSSLSAHLEHQNVFHQILRDKPDNEKHLIERLERIIVVATLNYARDKVADYFNTFDYGFMEFIANQIKKGIGSSAILSEEFIQMALGTMEEPEGWSMGDLLAQLDMHLGTLIRTKAAEQTVLEILEDRIKANLEEDEVNTLVLDFDSEMADFAGMNQISIETLESTKDV
jgi:hypothetical protein